MMRIFHFLIPIMPHKFFRKFFLDLIMHNAISLIIPCHRVIGANGSLTGYAGGIDKKRKLLIMENGVVFMTNGGVKPGAFPLK